MRQGKFALLFCFTKVQWLTACFSFIPKTFSLKNFSGAFFIFEPSLFFMRRRGEELAAVESAVMRMSNYLLRDPWQYTEGMFVLPISPCPHRISAFLRQMKRSTPLTYFFLFYNFLLDLFFAISHRAARNHFDTLPQNAHDSYPHNNALFSIITKTFLILLCNLIFHLTI